MDVELDGCSYFAISPHLRGSGVKARSMLGLKDKTLNELILDKKRHAPELAFPKKPIVQMFLV